jgi:uncharacterized protein with PIN domain
MPVFGKKFKCPICVASFDTEEELQVHSKIHAEEAREAAEFKCATCGRSFGSEPELDMHIRDSHMEFVNPK